MRKFSRQLMIVCLMISLAYCLFAILTPEQQSTEVSSGDARPERRGKILSYRKRLAHFDKQKDERREHDIPHQNLVDDIHQQTLQAEGRPVLFHYLAQLGPADKNELLNVLNVAAEARAQLLSDQVTTHNAIEQTRQSLGVMTQGLDGEFALATSQYLENLDRRRDIKREMAFREEEIQGLKLEIGSGSYRSQELTDASQTLQSLQAALDAVQTAISDYEKRLSNAETRSLLGSLNTTFHERLEAHKVGLAAALDQDVIIDKFDSIFAAMSTVQLDEI